MCFVDACNAVSIGDPKYLGFDSTIHLCNPSCLNKPHAEHAGMAAKAIGWVDGRSGSKNGVRDDALGEDYALKDYWVPAERKCTKLISSECSVESLMWSNL